MAALLIAGVVVVLVALYAADRVRKARSRARLLHAMNDRLTVAAAHIDQEQERRQAAARSSAELTSVMPAIRRPPLTLPGMSGHERDTAEDGPAAGDGQPAQAAAEQPAPEQPAPEQPAAEQPAPEQPAAEQPAAGEMAAQEMDGGRPDRRAEHTLTMPGLEAGEVPPLRLTGDGTLIMPTEPRSPAGDGALPEGPPGPEGTAGPAGGGPGPHPGPGN